MAKTLKKRLNIYHLVNTQLLLLALLTLIPGDLPYSLKLCAGFLPQNDLKIPVNVFATQGISKQDFDEVLDKAHEIFTPIFQQIGAEFVIERDWDDSTVNAYANQEGNRYLIKMFGGLARHQAMTKDGFTLVACHEIGHHLGGTPYYTNEWAATEGQADYFATLKCLRRFYQDENNQDHINHTQVDQTVKTSCAESFPSEMDQYICMRNSMAGLAGATLFSDLSHSSPPKFDTPDPTIVDKTIESHPPYQCRLDTYYQGSLCPVLYTQEIGQKDPNIGTCNRKTNDQRGLRPLCWFKPAGDGQQNPNPNPNPGPGGKTAITPTIHGQTQFVSHNPNDQIPVHYDVRQQGQRLRVILEVSQPNRDFANPNGNQLDPQNGLGYVVLNNSTGDFVINPMRDLPGWGNYSIRVMAIDSQDHPVGNFSSSAKLILVPQ